MLDYLTHLKNAYLIFKPQRNDLKGKRILEIGEKYYLHDSGLQHASITYKPNYINLLLGNFLLLDLLIKGYQVSIGKIDNKEIDFIRDKNNERLYLQVTVSLADENVKNRKYGNLLKVEDNYRKTVVMDYEHNVESYKGIETINIREFLMRIIKEPERV